MGNQYTDEEAAIIDHLKNGKLTNEDYELALTRFHRASKHDATPGEIEIDRVWNRRQADMAEARTAEARARAEAEAPKPGTPEFLAAVARQEAESKANYYAYRAEWESEDEFDREGGDNHPDATPQYDTIGNKRHGTY